ncbi:hypothetical protein GCM10027408_31450 [Microbacterium tumbae]
MRDVREDRLESGEIAMDVRDQRDAFEGHPTIVAWDGRRPFRTPAPIDRSVMTAPIPTTDG